MTAADIATAVAHYRKESWRLLAQVDAELERGDLEAASQALWDAAACGLKAAAARRGWPHDTFAEMGDATIRLIYDEGGTVDLNTNFIMASAFDRKIARYLPPHEAGIRYCSKGPIKEFLKVLEDMD